VAIDAAPFRGVLPLRSRGPQPIVSGEKDNTVPWAIANASFEREQRNSGVTEIVEMPD
jgi:non-heme chloroperoxidase